ncbi:hypothetical protein R6Q59_018887 [Mikania micrantha]
MHVVQPALAWSSPSPPITPLRVLPNATPAIAAFHHHPCCSTAIGPLRRRCRPNLHRPDVLQQPQVCVLPLSLRYRVSVLQKWIDGEGGDARWRRWLAGGTIVRVLEGCWLMVKVTLFLSLFTDPSTWLFLGFQMEGQNRSTVKVR